MKRGQTNTFLPNEEHNGNSVLDFIQIRIFAHSLKINSLANLLIKPMPRLNPNNSSPLPALGAAAAIAAADSEFGLDGASLALVAATSVAEIREPTVWLDIRRGLRASLRNLTTASQPPYDKSQALRYVKIGCVSV